MPPLMLLLLWMAAPGLSTNLFWGSWDFPQAARFTSEFSQAEKHLGEHGFKERKDPPVPDARDRLIWVLVIGNEPRQIDKPAVQLLDHFLAQDGSLLILIRADAQDNACREILRHFGMALNSEPVPAKIQLLSLPMLSGLRYRSPETRLLDVREDAFKDLLLVPNDLKQLTQRSNLPDKPGFRMILGKRPTGRIAAIAGAEAFANQSFSNQHPDILLRVCEWLAQR